MPTLSSGQTSSPLDDDDLGREDEDATDDGEDADDIEDDEGERIPLEEFGDAAEHGDRHLRGYSGKIERPALGKMKGDLRLARR